MIELKKLEQELSEKEKIFDEKYISGKEDYLSEEAEKMRHDIWSLHSKITDLKENDNDTNVGSIEDIARIAKLITTKFNNDYSIDNKDKEAIEHILSDYKRVLKEAKRYKNMYEAEHAIHLVRNEQLDRKENAVTKCNELIIENAKLKEENEELKKLIAHKNAYTKMLEKDLFENCSNYVISKQKIKDKIEEYKNILKTCNKAKDVDRIKAINERVLELEELLEKNEEESKCQKKKENKNIEK